MTTKWAAMVLLACALPACASQSAARDKTATLGYSDGRYFTVKHELPATAVVAPTGGAHAYAGRVVGEVCGVDVDFYSEYWGRRLDVSGFTQLDARYSASTRASSVRFDVRDGAKGREIFGSRGDSNVPLYPIELYLKPDSLVGTVGLRHYDLARGDGDELRGTVRTPTYFGEQTLPFVIKGAQELWQMPASDQAVLVPLMLSCLERVPGDRREERIMLGVDFRHRALAAADTK
ncbi:MAG TPA: hypothetical protein VIA18_33135 [Polyangia bacterium]|jgi:hypothetical protein|nr:hypothetical protein [Polyangia bacterium]